MLVLKSPSISIERKTNPIPINTKRTPTPMIHLPIFTITEDEELAVEAE